MMQTQPRILSDTPLLDELQGLTPFGTQGSNENISWNNILTHKFHFPTDGSSVHRNSEQHSFPFHETSSPMYQIPTPVHYNRMYSPLGPTTLTLIFCYLRREWGTNGDCRPVQLYDQRLARTRPQCPFVCRSYQTWRAKFRNYASYYARLQYLQGNVRSHEQGSRQVRLLSPSYYTLTSQAFTMHIPVALITKARLSSESFPLLQRRSWTLPRNP